MKTLEIPRHPAKFSRPLLPVMASRLTHCKRILDPFAGVGGVYALKSLLPDSEFVGVELEPEWAKADPRTIVGDARNLVQLFGANSFDAVVTSPTYGNRMADHHEAADASRRNTYRHALGRQLSEGNSGAMQWGEDYRSLHLDVWAQVHEVLRPQGVFLLNIKDHIRKGERVMVTDWHVSTIQGLGFQMIDREEVQLYGNGFGQNGQARVGYESVILFRKG